MREKRTEEYLKEDYVIERPYSNRPRGSASRAGVATRLAGIAAFSLGAGCGKAPDTAGLSPADVADYIHTVIEVDRATYTEEVVNRLQNIEHRISASEHYRDDKALPLPSQMLRMGAQQTAKKGKFRYSLVSTWAINKANSPQTPFEKAALSAVEANPESPYRSVETVGQKKYFMAAYADKAVSQACVNCHNGHEQSPRHDFKLGDVIGGIVISLPVD
jgi:hypothetical protein